MLVHLMRARSRTHTTTQTGRPKVNVMLDYLQKKKERKTATPNLMSCVSVKNSQLNAPPSVTSTCTCVYVCVCVCVIERGVGRVKGRERNRKMEAGKGRGESV